MDQNEILAERFETDRPRLRAIAYRLLGSASEADDALQEAWFRIARSDADAVENFGGWLTTIVARVCLDMLRTRKSRREDPIDAAVGASSRDATSQPEDEATLAEMVGLAMLVVLNALGPAERVSFVLHDMFDLPFESIATIVGKTPEATRQLASRARRRVRGGSAGTSSDVARHREVVDAFLAASRDGDFQGLMAVLAPNVVFRADEIAALQGSPREVRGASEVAKQFVGRARLARTALVDGRVGVVVAPLGRLLLAFNVTIEDGKIAALDVVMDPDQLAKLEFAALSV
jgi:RNA polymerase sigma-70 factor (ECF subfamily)